MINPEEFLKKQKQLDKPRLYIEIKNLSYRKLYTLIPAILLSVATIILFYIVNLPKSRLQHTSERFVELILEKQSEYLFFIGALIVSMCLLNNKKWISAKIMLIVGCVWVAFHDSATNWLYSLGIDSFSEVHNFAWSEAWFYLQTLYNMIHADFTTRHIIFFIIYVIVGIIIFLLLNLIRMRYGFEVNRFSSIKLFIGLFLIALSLNLVLRTALKNFNDSVNLFTNTAANFQNTPPTINFNRSGLKLIVYIGESTSAMNMGLYGYPRNTTPHLDNLYHTEGNLLRFKNVFSTHTYTSQSLLEALSVSANNNNDLLPITLRKRISLIDILNSGNINSYLYSNQGATGSWNLASAIIFKNADKKFSTQSVIAGNADNQLEKPSDDVFFEQNLMPGLQSLNTNKSAVIFLHSYSGHGEYLDNIPASFRQPVDDYINSRPANAIVGANFKFAQEVEHYDSAIKYVDFSVAKTIGQIKNSDQPVVLIYFSDHGDSAYSASGHEVGKFLHEMARVPFILYFNDKARAAYPQLFEKYKALSEQNNISTLAQLPATIIDLLGGDIENSTLKLPAINGAENDKNLQPLGIRETAYGKTYIDLTKIGTTNGNTPHGNVNDNATNIFVAANANPTKVCYGNSSTIGKALRGSLVTDCLELDINMPAEAAADIRDIVEIAQKKNLTLWLKAQTPENCEKITDTLNEFDSVGGNMLVEFPGSANLENSRWLACIDAIRKHKGRVAYSVPADELLACAQAIKSNPNPTANSHCQTLEADLQNAGASRLFTDFAFDYAGIGAMENSPAANKLSWNIGNVETSEFNGIKPERFNKVAIVNSNDPNNVD